MQPWQAHCHRPGQGTDWAYVVLSILSECRGRDNQTRIDQTFYLLVEKEFFASSWKSIETASFLF